MTKVLAVVLVVATLSGCASCPPNDYACEAHRQWQANVMAAGFANASQQQYQQAQYFHSQSYIPPVQLTNGNAIRPYVPRPIMTPSGEVHCELIDDPQVSGVKKAVCWKR